MMTDLTFASLLSSRICHDLISPVGAINNGLEILADESDPEMTEQAMGLIRNSAASASAKLQFMRRSFGMAGTVSEMVSLDEAKSLSLGLVGNGTTNLDWQVGVQSLDKPVVKLLLNMILIGFEALPRGGVLRVGVQKAGATNLMISAEGPKARLPQQAVTILRDGAELDTVEPREANMMFTHELAKSLGSSVHVSVGDETIEIAATI